MTDQRQADGVAAAVNTLYDLLPNPNPHPHPHPHHNPNPNPNPSTGADERSPQHEGREARVMQAGYLNPPAWA